MTAAILDVRDLTVSFKQRGRGLFGSAGEAHVAVDRVSFSVQPGETLGIVGESGSGKTSLVRALLRAIDPGAGSAIFQSDSGPVDLCQASKRELIGLRTEIQMVFQDPFASLNPRMKVADILTEPLAIHEPGDKRNFRARAASMLEQVGLETDALQRFPHAFSGGQRQRIGIARALMLGPKLLVLDEAISALDVSVQAQILNLLRDLQRDMGLTYLFVAHDLNVVEYFCDTAIVLYGGRLVESGPASTLFAEPRHDYTRLLASAIPSPDPDIRLAPLDRRTLRL